MAVYTACVFLTFITYLNFLILQTAKTTIRSEFELYSF